MAELVDALDSGSSGVTPVGVRVPSSAPGKSRDYRDNTITFFCCVPVVVPTEMPIENVHLRFLRPFSSNRRRGEQHMVTEMSLWPRIFFTVARSTPDITK